MSLVFERIRGFKTVTQRLFSGNLRRAQVGFEGSYAFPILTRSVCTASKTPCMRRINNISR
jgi:hypothetical protein